MKLLQRKKRTQSSIFRFTLLEMIIVLVVIALALSLVIPRVGVLPRRLQREQLFSNIEDAFRNAGIRARTQGSSVEVYLDTQDNKLRLRYTNQASKPQQSGGDKEEEPRGTPGFLSEYDNITLPEDIKWRGIKNGATGSRKEIVYRFFPNGEATGPRVRFEFLDNKYQLSVDNFTGSPRIKSET